MEQLQVDSCTICLESLASPDGGDPSRTPCNHRFHQHCLKEWFINGIPGHWCPLCKRPLHEVERFDALFGGGTSDDPVTAEELQALLEQRAEEEETRIKAAAQRLQEAHAKCDLAFQQYSIQNRRYHQAADEVIAGYDRLSESFERLEKDKEELDKAENYLEENKREEASVHVVLLAQQVVEIRQRQYDRDVKRHEEEKEQVERLKERLQVVRKEIDDEDKLVEEQRRNIVEETSRFGLALRRYEVAEILLTQF